MPFNKKYNYDFFIKDDHLVLSDEYLKNNLGKFKKITGTRLSSVLNKNEYISPVKVWSMMVNIYNEPMDKMYADAGNIIEPKIHQWVCNHLNLNFKQYNPISCQWDVFKNNQIFGGIPDGEPIDDNGNFLYPNQPILEIKTTSIDAFKFKKINGLLILEKDINNHPVVKSKGEKRKKWFDSNNNIIIPQEYLYQLGLYCYLRNTSKGIFAICFLETDDYINPELTDIKNREIYLVDIDIDLNSFKNEIDNAEKWYHEYIEKGISPKLSKNDLDWLKTQIEGL